MAFPIRRVISVAAIACASLVSVSGPASAGTVCDLINNTTCPAINGGYFFTDEQHPTGTGFIDSFERIQQNGWEQGYNTSARPLQDSVQMKVDPNFTRNLTLADVGTKVLADGFTYREFFLDVNEPAAVNGNKNFITLDQLEVFGSNTKDLNNYCASGPNNGGGTLGLGASCSNSTKLYDLDTDSSDNYVQIDYLVNGNGSGSSDLVFYLRNSLFTGFNYVYLFSQFGDLTFKDPKKYESQSGFEEWFTKSSIPPPTVTTDPVPEPGSLFLLGSGLTLMVRRRLRARA